MKDILRISSESSQHASRRTRHRETQRRQFFRPLRLETLEDRRLLTIFAIDLSPAVPGLNAGSNPYTIDHAVGLAAPNESAQPASSATGNETGTGITYNDATNELTLAFAYGADAGFVNLALYATNSDFT